MANDITFTNPYDEEFDTIRQRMMGYVESLWPDPNNRPDLREGSLAWTFLSAVSYEVQNIQQQLNDALELSFVQFTFGDFLDLKGAELGVERLAGVPATGNVRFLGDIGTIIPTGSTAITSDIDDGLEDLEYQTTVSSTIIGVENPANIDEIQTIRFVGAGTFKVTFDGEETTTTFDQTSTGSDIASVINSEIGPGSTNFPTGLSVTGDSGEAGLSSGAGITFSGSGVSGQDIDLATYGLSITSIVGTNEVQTLEVTGTGTFKLTFDGDETTTTFNQNDTGTTIAAAITSDLGGGTLHYPNGFTVTGSVGTIGSGGCTITFDGGDVEYQDVPLLEFTSVSGLTTTSVEETTTGNTPENSVEESTKGRNAAAEIISANQNEIQVISYLPTNLETSITQEAVAGTDNEKQTIFFNGTPSSGTVDIVFNDGNTTDELSNYAAQIVPADTASSIQTKLESLSNIASGDLTVTQIGAPATVGAGSFFIEIEFGGSLRNLDLPVLQVGSGGNSLNGGTTLIFNTTQTGVPGTNAKHVLEYTNGSPTGGVFSILIEDDENSGSEILEGISATTSAGDLQDLLESLVIYANGGDPSGTNFLVTGPSLDDGPITIEFKGINRGKTFKNFLITTDFVGVATSGTFDLTFNDNNTSDTASSIPYNVSAATLQTTLEGLSNLDPGEVTVSVVAGGSTLDTLGTVFAIEIDNTVNVTNPDYPLLEASGSTLTTFTHNPSVPDDPVIVHYQRGTSGQNNIQFLTLSHPTGIFRLSDDSSSTDFLSPVYETNTTIDTALETLFGASQLTTTGGPLSSDSIEVEFSGGSVDNTAIDLVTVDDEVPGLGLGGILEIKEAQRGASSSGSITGNVQYVYTLVTKIGVSTGVSDPDYEEGYGETAYGVASSVESLTNQRVLVKIDPIRQFSGLYQIKKLNLYRSLNSGPYKLIGEIDGEDLIVASEGGVELNQSYIYFVDNISAGSFSAITVLAPETNLTGVVDVPSEATDSGTIYNISARRIETLDLDISGVERVTNPELFSGGTDDEDDDAYRSRILNEAQKDPGSGNIDDYESMATSISSVNAVTVIPEWQEKYGPLEGPGTVKVVVSGSSTKVLSDSVVEQVRQYIAGTKAITDPSSPPTLSRIVGGDIESGDYEYVYTFINSGKGETAPSDVTTVSLTGSYQTVTLTIPEGPSGTAAANTIGRRIYRRKIDGAISGQPDSEKFCLVEEILDNTTTSYTDSAAFLDLPTWTGYPLGNYERRKAPRTNSTSLFDGNSPIGAHVTVDTVTGVNVWIDATVLPADGYSISGSGGLSNITDDLNSLFDSYLNGLSAGQDVKIKEIENIMHDYEGVTDFENVVIYSDDYPTGVTTNLVIEDDYAAIYSEKGTITSWTGYSFN